MIRAAQARDRRAIRAVDQATRSTLSSPAPFPSSGRRIDLENTFVAEFEGSVAGYVELGAPTRLPATEHVLQIYGLAVSPAQQGRGLGRALVEAAIEHAHADSYRQVLLRVLGHNAPARALYESCGFEVAGVLREFFLLDGAYVDDVWMTLDLTAAG
jgi:ribosomal protein S18 acetylase RimI-like enzyme